MAVEALELLKHVPDDEDGGGGGGGVGDMFDGSMKKMNAMALDQDDDDLGGPLRMKGNSFARHSANQAERERSARVMAKDVLDAL